MDAIALLKADHATVESLFRRFEATGNRAYKTKHAIVVKIVTELSVHAAIEEQVFYPAVRAEVPELMSDVLEAIEEHHIVKWTLSELEDMDPKEENFTAKVTVLIESVRHHVKEEEGNLFPSVRNAVSRAQLTQWASDLVIAKEVAPTHPHPRTPATPPGNLVAGTIAGVFDRVKDAGAAALGRQTT